MKIEKSHMRKRVAWHKTIFPFWSLFLKNQFKNTSNLILLGFKMSSESFFHKNFKTGLTFWHMWFFNFQNLVRSCQHIDGTPCIYFFFFFLIFPLIRVSFLFYHLFRIKSIFTWRTYIVLQKEDLGFFWWAKISVTQILIFL